MKVARIKEKNSNENGDGRSHSSITKINSTYAIVSEQEDMFVTRDEMQAQTGIPLPSNIKDFMFEGWLDEVKKDQKKLRYMHKISDAELLAPIPNPPKIVCLAFNYYDHARDAGLSPSDEPVIFLKPRTALNSPFGNIIAPGHIKRLDYEAELAVIIGKETKKASEQEAGESIFGYMIFHDVSARDIQFKDKQFTRGKGIDTFAPCGPWITTKDEVGDPQNLRIMTKVNGETRQNSSTNNMVLSVKRIISDLSKMMTLEPGDIVSTGTPAGVAMSMKEPRYLKDGDTVEISIEKLAAIRNRVVFS